LTGVRDSSIFNPSFRRFCTTDTTASLTTGSLWRNIWQLSWPMLLIMVFNFFMGFTDVYVAGLIGPEIQAAVGFVTLLFFLVIIVANAIAIGTVALVSRAIGAGDFPRALEAARQSLLCGLAIAAALTAVALCFADLIVRAAGFPAPIREIAVTFLKIFATVLGTNYLLIISNALFRASGEVTKPLFTMALVGLVNVVGDFALVFGWFPFPALGYRGIAVATAAASAVGMAINLLLLGMGRWRALYRRGWSPLPGTIRQIFTIGWPAAMLQIAWNAGTIVLYNLLGRLGEASITALAAIANGLRIEALIFLPAFALNMSASVLVGQNLGAGNPERAERAGWRTAVAGMGLLTALAIPVFIWAEELAALVAKDPAVLAETARYLRINMISQPFIALSLSLGGGLQGAGDTRGTMWVIVIAVWLIRLPLAWLLALGMGWGAPGVWGAMCVSMIGQGLMMAGRFRGGKWKAMTLT